MASSAVRLDEVRRRNLMRMAAMAGGAFVNYWIAAMVVVLFASTRVAGGSSESKAATPDPGTAWVQVMLIGAVVAAVGVAVYVATKVRGASRATVKALGPGVSSGSSDRRLGNLAEELALAVGIRPVEVAVLDDPVPNALSVGTGRRTTIVVTSGMLDTLTRDELEAVLAVQMFAIKRLDVALRTIVGACVAGAIAVHDDTKPRPSRSRDGWYVGQGSMPPGCLTLYLLPIRILSWPSWRFALRLRQRAYADADMGADDMAVAMMRNPDALRTALTKVLRDHGVVRAVTPANAHLWLEPLPDGVADRDIGLARHSMDASLEMRIANLAPRGTAGRPLPRSSRSDRTQSG